MCRRIERPADIEVIEGPEPDESESDSDSELELQDRSEYILELVSESHVEFDEDRDENVEDDERSAICTYCYCGTVIPFTDEDTPEPSVLTRGDIRAALKILLGIEKFYIRLYACPDCVIEEDDWYTPISEVVRYRHEQNGRSN